MMSRYKLLGIVSAMLVVIVGAVYLKVGEAFLSPTLLVSTAAIFAMGLFSALEVRSKGERGVGGFIPAICLFVLSAALLFLWIYVVASK